MHHPISPLIKWPHNKNEPNCYFKVMHLNWEVILVNHLSKVIHAYNCTSYSSKGRSPYYLLFGRKPRLAKDLILRREKDSPPKYYHKKYLESWTKEMDGASEIARLKSGPSLGIFELVTKTGLWKTRVVWK